MKSICVKDSARLDQLDRVNKSCSVSAFIQVFVTVKSGSVTTVYKSLARSESCVQKRSRSWDRLSHMVKVCRSVQAHIEVSTQDQMLFWSPTHEFLDLRQNRLELSQCLSSVRHMG